MQVRTAEPRDWGIITDFNIRLAEESESLTLNPAIVGEGVKALLGDSLKGMYYLAVLDGEVAGQVMVTYEWSDWRNACIWWLQSVYVRHEFRRRGVFRALFAHVGHAAQSAPRVCGIRLYMHDQNTGARSAYQELGMAPTRYIVMEMELGSHKSGQA